MLGQVLLTAVNAVAPILLLILLGYILRQKNILTEDFIDRGNWLVFHICLPMMLFVNVYNIDGFGAVRWDVVIYAVAAICLLVVLGAVTAVLTTRDPRGRGVLMQAVFRSNYAIIGLPLAQLLGGDEAAAVASVVSAVAIPLFNVCGVIALTVFLKEDGRQRTDVGKLIGTIVRNPLIVAVAAGLLALGLRQLQLDLGGRLFFSLRDHLPFLYRVLQELKAVTTPLALIVLGGKFTFSAVRGMLPQITVGTVMRIVVSPLIGIGLAVWLSGHTALLQCGSAEYAALLALFGTPVAVTSAVMAGAMGNDRQLATQLVVWTSIGSVVTLFVGVCVMIARGLLTV